MESVSWHTLLLGVILCYAGYPLFDFSLLAFGLAAGGAVGYLLGHTLIGTETGAIGVAFLGGLLGTLLLRVFVRAGLFLIGACLGTGICLLQDLEPGLALLCGFLGGVLVLFASRWVLILGTALAGALFISLALAGIRTLPVPDPLSGNPLMLLFCFLTGVATQLLLTPKRS